MTNDMIDTKQLEIDAEFINNAIDMADRGVTMAVTGAITAGSKLIEVKVALPHGEWAAWIGRSLNCSQAKANRYMRIASNSSCVTNLKDAKSINEALRMIGGDDKVEDEPENAPRSERKTGQVEVVAFEEFEQSDCASGIPYCGRDDEAGQTDVQTDDDPTPDPPTQRKTAKGTEKVKETDKPKTAAITPEIIDDDPKAGPTDAVEAYLDVVSPVQVVRDVLTRITDDGVRVKEAKRIRKEMDKFDPPTKFTKPDLEDVSAYMHTLGDAVGRDVSIAADGFMDHYQSNGWMVGKVAMKDWRATARKWMKNQGEFLNGKANGNGRRTTATQDPASCLGANGRPKIEHRKINYK